MSDDEPDDVGEQSAEDADIDPDSPNEPDAEDKEEEEDEGDEKNHDVADEDELNINREEKTEFLNSTQIHEPQDDIPKLTPHYMTKYERARILGVRAFQICLGAPVMVELVEGEIDPLVIALKELKVRFVCDNFMNNTHVCRNEKSRSQFVALCLMERLRY